MEQFDPLLAASGARIGAEAIAGLYGVLGAAIVVGVVIYLFFRNWIGIRWTFAVAVWIGLFIFVGWLSQICGNEALRLGGCGPFQILCLIDPIDILDLGALVFAVLLTSLIAFRSIGAFVTITPFLVTVAVGEWWLFTHFVAEYATCVHL